MVDWRREIEQRVPPAAREGDILQELALHLEDRFEELRAAGRDDADARRMVLDELDDTAALQRELRLRSRRRATPLPPLGVERRAPFGADLWQDVRFGLRMLRKSPGFTAVVVLTLGLGIGANTAIFTVINAVMLRPLPFVDADRLVRIYESSPPRGWPTFSASQPNYLDWTARSRSFAQLAATAGTAFNVTQNAETERVVGSAVTHGFLPVLGVVPAVGRNFLPEEDRPGGNVRVAILTYGCWQRRFGGDPNVLARTISLTGTPYTIVGVLPERFAWGAANLDVLVPLAPDPAQNRSDHRLLVIGRLRDGVTIDAAQADLAAVASALAQQYPESNKDWTVQLRSFYDWIVPEESRQSLTVFGLAVIAVLLIACSNVASLLLARATGRDREISVRLALGARRGRLVRQLLVEALLLAVVAGAAGLVMAWGATDALRALSPTTLPRLDEVSIDARAIGFCLGISLLTGLLFGLVPAIMAARTDLHDTLKEGSRSGSAGRRRQGLRSALIVGELALSVALLVGAGLLLRSFWQVQQVDPGFHTSRLLTLRIVLPPARYTNREQAWSFYDRLHDGIRALPGVEAVTITSAVPLGPGSASTEVQVPGRTTATEADKGSANWWIVGPGYFQAMGIPLRGREFTAADTGEGLPVTIISEATARRYWPGEDALGKTVILSSVGKGPQTIVGIVGDVRSFGLDNEPGPAVYFPTPTAPRWNPMTIVVRTAVEPATLVTSVRGVLRGLDPTLPFFDIATVDELLDRTLGPRRFMMFLTACFAAVALILASVGLFGVMAYLVTQRLREIGIRLALGAKPVDVFRTVLGRGLLLAMIGALVGLGGALRLTPLLETFLFQIERRDPVTFIGAPVLLVLVALLACYLPARRAMRIDPLVALREE